MISPSSVDEVLAAENGRRFAARAIAENPDQKKRVEDTYGVAYTKARYPEAYQSGFGRFLDRINPFK